mmetsp:Transcript_17548/g.43784  ORF Transcript_17548/g.43784 Transcript_17548/m.43784 type:complete len:202 (-) Transcript_17548:327-932(-)
MIRSAHSIGPPPAPSRRRESSAAAPGPETACAVLHPRLFLSPLACSSAIPPPPPRPAVAGRDPPPRSTPARPSTGSPSTTAAGLTQPETPTPNSRRDPSSIPTKSRNPGRKTTSHRPVPVEPGDSDRLPAVGPQLQALRRRDRSGMRASQGQFRGIYSLAFLLRTAGKRRELSLPRLRRRRWGCGLARASGYCVRYSRSAS